MCWLRPHYAADAEAILLDKTGRKKRHSAVARSEKPVGALKKYSDSTAKHSAGSVAA